MSAAARQGTHDVTKSVSAAARQGTHDVTKSVCAAAFYDPHFLINWTMASILAFEENLSKNKPQHIAGVTNVKVARKNDDDNQPSPRYCPNTHCGKANCKTIHTFDPNVSKNNSNNCDRENDIRGGNRDNSQDSRA